MNYIFLYPNVNSLSPGGDIMYFLQYCHELEKDYSFELALATNIFKRRRHYAYPTKVLDGTGFISHLFGMYDLYHHNGIC